MVQKDDDAWSMVETRQNQFVVDGQPFYVNGFNTYWLMIFAADQSTRGKVTEVFKQAASVGLTVCRTWAFNDGQWRALQKSPSVYDEEVFKVLLRTTIIMSTNHLIIFLRDHFEIKSRKLCFDIYSFMYVYAFNKMMVVNSISFMCICLFS